MDQCTLCGGLELEPVRPPGDRRTFYHCKECDLIFGDKRFYLSAEAERKRYDLHNNGLHNRGYVAFLKKVITPALPFLHKNMVGLDYGCGPNPTLSRILEESDFVCHNYDPLFGYAHPERTFDFIFATECFEHFFRPGEVIRIIDRLLAAGGYLAVMTERWKTLDGFAEWYYKRDATHVSFYHTNSFSWICRCFNYEIVYCDSERVMILRKGVSDQCRESGS